MHIQYVWVGGERGCFSTAGAELFGADGRLPSAVYSELGCKMLSRSPAAVGERCENTLSGSLRMV